MVSLWQVKKYIYNYVEGLSENLINSVLIIKECQKLAKQKYNI